MKVAVLTLCYNEEETIGAVMRNWDGKVHKHLVLHTDKPWHGQEQPHDKTESIVKEFLNAEFIRLPWKSEHEQRNWGLARLYDYDYVLIVDADELYEESTQQIILNRIGEKRPFEDNQDCYRLFGMRTYFKDLDHILDPPDGHKPVIAVNPKKILFTECRIPDTDYQIPIEATMHHLSFSKSDKKIFNKIRQFEHYNQIKYNWYENVWKKWEEGTTDVRAYGHEISKAIYSPAPQEIKDLI